jgi:hypothetical protein
MDHSDKHKGKHKHDEESAEKDTEQDKTTGTASTASGNTPTADGDLFGKGVVGQTPTDIKPIPSPAAPSGSQASGTATGSGNGIVRVSDGKGNSILIPDHGAGVTVTSGGPGKLTISNGVQTQTLSGIKVTISGASAVAVSKGLGVGRPDTPGSVVVMSPNGTVTGNDPFGTLGHEIEGTAKQFGKDVGSVAGHLDPRVGFGTHPLDQTSTVQQQ